MTVQSASLTSREQHGQDSAEKVKNGAWWTFVAVCFMLLGAGTNYGFSLWNPVLKADGGYGYTLSQTEVELLGTIAHMGNYINLDAGFISDRFSMQMCLALGCIYMSVGFTGLYVAIVHGNGQVPFAVLAFLCFLYGHGCTSISTPSMAALVKGFPQHKGNAVGCAKGLYGMASTFVSMIYFAVFKSYSGGDGPSGLAGFLIFLGVYMAVVGVIFVPIVKYTQGVVREPPSKVLRKFQWLMGSIFAFMMFFLVINIFKKQWSVLQERPAWLVSLIIVCCGLSGIFLLVRGSGANSEFGADTAVVARPKIVFEGSSGIGLFKSIDFWIMAFTLICIQGSGLLWLNHAHQIVVALGGKLTTTTAYVATISCFNGLGRLIYGNLSEYTMGSTSRVWYLIVSTVVFTISYMLVALVGSPMVWTSGCLIGFAYGGLWGVIPALIPEIFGIRDYGFKYACFCLPNLAASLIFPTLLAGRIYDWKNHNQETDCLSRSCYNLTFWIMTLCCALSALSLCFIHYRTRAIYAQIQEAVRASA